MIKNTVEINCLVTTILQNIVFCVQQMKGLEQEEDE